MKKRICIIVAFGMMRYLLLLKVFLILDFFSVLLTYFIASVNGRKIRRRPFCPCMELPSRSDKSVCGSDGNTYSSRAYMKCLNKCNRSSK